MTSLFTIHGEPLSLIILAGGSSTRMNRNKALLPIGGSCLIQHIQAQLENRFGETLISISDHDEDMKIITGRPVIDKIPDQGPMMGIWSCLLASKFEKSFVIACDIPYIHLEFLERMTTTAEDYEIVIPETPRQRLEPLLGIYSRSTTAKMNHLLASGKHSLLDLFPLCRTKRLRLDNDSWLKNLNTRKDYESYLKQFSNRKYAE